MKSLQLFLAFIVFGSTALAASKTQDDVLTGLFAACDKSFVEYEKELGKVREIMKAKYGSMDQKKIDELDGKEDVGLFFVRLNWPDDIKDETITIYKDCAGRVAYARDVLLSKQSTVKDRRQIVQEVHACISHVFSAGRRIVPPFDRMLACYQKHVGK